MAADFSNEEFTSDLGENSKETQKGTTLLQWEMRENELINK